MTDLVLHYAPDNASLCVRLALEELNLPYRTSLVDRARQAQRSADYLALNPAGTIPVLETSQGPIFETAAILLWLADAHRDGPLLMPGIANPTRGAALKWLFHLSNTLHPALRILFYPDQHVGPKLMHQVALNEATRARVIAVLERLDRVAAAAPPWLGRPQPSILDCYLCPMLRWLALYPRDATGWFALSRWPHLVALAQRMEARPSTLAAVAAEGLGPTPFSAPILPQPPQGSAT